MQTNPNINAERIKGHLQLNESSSTAASLNLIPGSIPTTKTSGDVLVNSDRLKFIDSTLTVNTIAYLSDISVGGVSNVTGTTNRITVTGTTTKNVDISTSYVGQTSITTLGTITSGTWQATAIADTYISSAATWNAKQNALSGTGFVKISGSTISYDNSTYLTANQSITLSGQATGTGSTAITVTLDNASVIAKTITGYTGVAGTITASDTLLSAINKLNGNTTLQVQRSINMASYNF